MAVCESKPAEGEGLAGGGALMSANLLNGITPTLMNGTTESDGIWHHARTSIDSHEDWLVWDLAGQPALATNQTYHFGLSAKGASASSGYLRTSIGYKDAAGNLKWASSNPLPIGTSWGRAEATIVVPSGMTPFAFYVAAYGTCPETWMTAATLSYGSPVTLASSAHTPYATQDYVMVTYATKAEVDALVKSLTDRVAALEKVKFQTKSVTPSTSLQTIMADTGYDALSSVSVAAIPYAETDNSAGGKTATIAGV